MSLQAQLEEFRRQARQEKGAVFCSSLEALRKVYELGLEKDVEILTRAPALLASGNPSVTNLDDRTKVSRKDLYRFSDATNGILEQCMGLLESDDALKPFARIVLRTIWIFQMRAICSAFLCECDAYQPRLILNATLEGEDPSAFTYYPWRKLLAHNPLASAMDIPLPVPDHMRGRSQTEPRLRRLQIRGPGHFFRRLHEVVGRRLPDGLFRGDYFSVNGTELENDISVVLARRMFKLHSFKLPRLEPRAPTSDIDPLSDATMSAIWECYAAHLAGIAPAFVLEVLREDLREQIDAQIKLYRRTRNMLQSSEQLGRGGRPMLFTTNYPQNAAFLALTDTLFERGVLLIGVQHGITRELVDNPQNTVNYENVITPRLFCLTRRGVELSGKSAFRRPESAVFCAGLPQAFRNLRRTCDRRGTLRRAQTILYAQPHTRVGGVFAGAGYRDDREASDHESMMFRDVLGALPHPVVVKPYPESAYLDEDPAINVAKSQPNISIDETGWDLRFLLPESWLVVTVGATSTLSWIYWSGRPFMYVDPPCTNLRLKPELVEVFRECASYFDQSDSGYLGEMKTWLSRPRGEIVAAWAQNETVRQERLADVFGDHRERSLRNLINDQLRA
jgi:hypothetical protein